MSVCNMDCLNCVHSDCVNTKATPTLEEYEFSRRTDNAVLSSRPTDHGVGSRQNRKPYDVKYYKTHRQEHLKRCKEYRE